MSILPGFVGQSYVSVSQNIATEVLQNWIPQTVEVQYEKARLVYLPTPGLTLKYTLPFGPVRALFSQDGRDFAVGGQRFFETTGGTVTNFGALQAVDANPATVVSNGTVGHQFYITSGGLGNIFDLNTNTLSAITAAGYPSNTLMGTYLDSYFLTTKGQSVQFNISAIFDGTSWNGLDFAIRTAASDNLVGIIQNNKIIWLIGSATSEPWYDAGVASFPYLAVPQVLVPFGCCAPFSICRVTTIGDGAVCWLHQSTNGRGQFVLAQQYQPTRISTYAVEATWQTYPTMTDCVAYTYTDQGHEFIVLTFPSGNATWVFDVSEKLWHQRMFWNVATGNADRHRVWVHALSAGQHVVGDWQNGNVYVYDNAVSTDNGTLMRRVRRSPHSSNENKQSFYSQFILDLEGGVGTANGVGNAPTALLQWSDDGGHTFNSGVQMNVGAIGQFSTRCFAPGSLGQSRDRVFQVSMSDPVPQRVLQAYVTVTPGTN